MSVLNLVSDIIQQIDSFSILFHPVKHDSNFVYIFLNHDNKNIKIIKNYIKIIEFT